MAEYKWPEEGKRSLIGKRISRVDGPDKVSGKAKYTFDINRPGMLFGKILRSPYAHAKITKIDISAAEKMPGVKKISIMQKEGAEIQWAGADIVFVAAVDEPTADGCDPRDQSGVRETPAPRQRKRSGKGAGW